MRLSEHEQRQLDIDSGEALDRRQAHARAREPLDALRVIKTLLSYANQDVVSAAVAQANRNEAYHVAVASICAAEQKDETR